MLLDLLMRTERVELLRKWVLDLLSDAAFLAGKDRLRTTLEAIRARMAGTGSGPTG
jgi:hypothetical protein